MKEHTQNRTEQVLKLCGLEDLANCAIGQACCSSMTKQIQTIKHGQLFYIHAGLWYEGLGFMHAHALQTACALTQKKKHQPCMRQLPWLTHQTACMDCSTAVGTELDRTMQFIAVTIFDKNTNFTTN